MDSGVFSKGPPRQGKSLFTEIILYKQGKNKPGEQASNAGFPGSRPAPWLLPGKFGDMHKM